MPSGEVVAPMSRVHEQENASASARAPVSKRD
jgi:hypothetical protein